MVFLQPYVFGAVEKKLTSKGPWLGRATIIVVIIRIAIIVIIKILIMVVIIVIIMIIGNNNNHVICNPRKILHLYRVYIRVIWG